MKRTFLALVMVSIMAFGLIGCGNSASSEESNAGSDSNTGSDSNADSDSNPGSDNSGAEESDIFIGISIGDSTQERWQKEIQMFKDYADELGVEVTIQTAENDAAKQQNQCENMISQGVNVIICQPIDCTGAGAIAKACEEAGVVSIAYDRFINNGPLSYWVGFDDIQVGEVEAQMVVDAMGGKGNLVILKGDEAMVTTHDVYKGNMNVLQPYIDDGSITVVAEQYCKGWSSDEALAHLENALSQNKNEVDGVLCQNDGIATGAVQALSGQGLAGTVAVSGQDCDLSAVQRVVEGTQTGDVYKPLEKMNHACIDIAVEAAKGGDPVKNFTLNGGNWSEQNNGAVDVPSMLLDVVLVNKDNVVDILTADNFYTEDEINKNVTK